MGAPPPWAPLPEPERVIDEASLRDRLAAAPPPEPALSELGGARPSAVLAPLFTEDGELHVVLTRRAKHLRSHRGEVCFPGGGVEGDESIHEAAFREAYEEVRLAPDGVEVLGELDHLQTYTSRSFIVPVVAMLPGRPTLEPDPAEVDAVLVVPVRELLRSDVYREERWGLHPLLRPLYFFELVGDTVWGATASMLRNLLAIGTDTPWRG